MKLFQKALLSLSILALVEITGNQSATAHALRDMDHQFQTVNRPQVVEVSRQKPSNGKNQGLSEAYHGHKSNRPETVNPKKGKPPAANIRFIQVQLLGINDLHGQLNVTRKVNGKPVGRVDYLAAYLKQREAENKNTLLVQDGDMVGASPPVSALLQDEPTIEILNKLGFDIGTVGNHEFDEGLTELMRLIKGGTHPKTGNFAGSNFPWIVANVVNEKTGKTILPPYQVIKVNGMPIGFIGVVTTETPKLVVPSGVAGLHFTDEVEAINRNVAELKKQGVKSIVVLAHNPGTSGPNGENPVGQLVDIANRVDDEVDIIFGGHNHAYMNATIDNKLVVQSYSYGTAFSDVDLEIDPKTKDIVSKRAEIVTTFQEGIEPDPEIKKMIEGYEAKIEPIVNQVVGSSSESLTAKQNENGESVLGDFIADAQRKALNTELAFMNPGGIRADIDPGDITWGEIYTVQPFNNDLVKMSMTGQQIRELLNQQWGATKTNMLQISGLSYTWDPNKPAGQRVVSTKLPDGTEMDPNKSYSVTANIFLSGGGDGFTVFTQAKNKEVGPVDLDALVNFSKAQPKPFTYGIQNRIQRVQ
ncbi:bifunctional UDP-sugar hydrolase/5'-nucleotidase [Neobacillus sp. BF23-41]|uniref:bifunctional metallophosphatase/5'-nucleotidase n=1 Tax=Neobacillus sp. BF23-41 TaxID=3240280 RepID=UPI0034E4A178